MRKGVRIWTLAVIIAVAGLSPMPASAQWQDGNQLHAACQDKTPKAFLYIFGVIDGLDVGVQSGGKRLYCIPKGVTGVQLRDVVCQYLQSNPSQRQTPAAYQAIDAMQTA